MGDQYIGEIRMFGGTFAPQGWAFCNGQILPISGNEALFSLIGNTYGGDGQTNFALPNLQGRAPVHMSATYPIGQASGTETVTLLPNHLPQHTHVVQAATAAGDIANPAGKVWAASGAGNFASNATGAVAMSPQAVTAVGGGQAHDNMMPFLTVNYIIALAGIYPTFD
jgi:microcystin-dependent protein